MCNELPKVGSDSASQPRVIGTLASESDDLRNCAKYVKTLDFKASARRPKLRMRRFATLEWRLEEVQYPNIVALQKIRS